MRTDAICPVDKSGKDLKHVSCGVGAPWGLEEGFENEGAGFVRPRRGIRHGAYRCTGEELFTDEWQWGKS